MTDGELYAQSREAHAMRVPEHYYYTDPIEIIFVRRTPALDWCRRCAKLTKPMRHSPGYCSMACRESRPDSKNRSLDN